MMQDNPNPKPKGRKSRNKPKLKGRKSKAKAKGRKSAQPAKLNREHEVNHEHEEDEEDGSEDLNDAGHKGSDDMEQRLPFDNDMGDEKKIGELYSRQPGGEAVVAVVFTTQFRVSSESVQFSWF